MATWVGAPSPAATTSTGLGGGTGQMVVGQTIGTPAQNSPFTSQPSWVGAPRNTSLANATTGVAL